MPAHKTIHRMQRQLVVERAQRHQSRIEIVAVARRNGAYRVHTSVSCPGQAGGPEGTPHSIERHHRSANQLAVHACATQSH